MKKIILLMAAIVFLCLGGIAQADISYTVYGWSQQFPAATTPPANAPWGPNGYPGDTVELQTYTGTLDLTPGNYTQKINTLKWKIDYTYGGTATNPNVWSDLTFNFSAPRSISIGSATGTLSQTGTLEATWDNDFLSFSNGSTIKLSVPGYNIDITPLGLARVGGSDFSGSNPWVQPERDILARFEVTEATAVPEPGILILLGLSMVSIAGLRRWWKE